MNSIKKLFTIYCPTGVSHQQLWPEATQQIQALSPYFDTYLKGEENILVISSTNESHVLVAQYLIEMLGNARHVQYETTEVFLADAIHPTDPEKAASTVK